MYATLLLSRIAGTISMEDGRLELEELQETKIFILALSVNPCKTLLH